MSTLNVNADGCTCPPLSAREVAAGVNASNRHTSDVDSSINDEVLRTLIGMERCPVEYRALCRILNARHAHLVWA